MLRTMAHIIIHRDGAFNVYTTICDAPIFDTAITVERLREWHRDEHGRAGEVRLEDALQRAVATGTSCRLSRTLCSTLLGNHAGPDGSEMPFDEFVAKYLTLPA